MKVHKMHVGKATVDVLTVDTKQNTHLHLTESNFLL